MPSFGKSGRVQSVGDLWDIAGTVLSGLGDIAGTVVPVLLNQGGNTGSSGGTVVVANPNQTAKNDNTNLLLCGAAGLLVLVLALRRK